MNKGINAICFQSVPTNESNSSDDDDDDVDDDDNDDDLSPECSFTHVSPSRLDFVRFTWNTKIRAEEKNKFCCRES